MASPNLTPALPRVPRRIEVSFSHGIDPNHSPVAMAAMPSSGPLLCACLLTRPQQDLLLSALALTLEWASLLPQKAARCPRVAHTKHSAGLWPIPSACLTSSGWFLPKSRDSARSQVSDGLKQEPRLCRMLCSAALAWPNSALWTGTSHFPCI